jgi:hypothetical protein
MKKYEKVILRALLIVMLSLIEPLLSAISDKIAKTHQTSAAKAY